MASQIKTDAQCSCSLGNPEETKWKCLDCKIDLCDRDKESHMAVPALKGHQIIPLTKDTEMVVDQLASSTIHNDTPIVFFCNDCKEQLCYKCQESSHRTHDMVMVETALDKPVPEIEENTKFVDKELQSVTPQISGLSRYHPGNFKEFFSKQLNKKAEIILDCFTIRISIINDRIWVPSYSSNVIKIYSKVGDLQKIINLKTPGSLTQTQTGDILVACEGNGLYSVSEKDDNSSIHIADGSYSDVATWNDIIYAWEYHKKQIVEFHKNGKWQRYRHIGLNYAMSGGEIDTLLLAPSHDENTLQFFIASYGISVIYHINAQGQLLQQYSGALGGKISLPFLCGIDSQHQLLVADQCNWNYKLLDINTGQWSEVFTAERNVVDAIMDGDQIVWLLKFNGTKWTVVKYEC